MLSRDSIIVRGSLARTSYRLVCRTHDMSSDEEVLNACLDLFRCVTAALLNAFVPALTAHRRLPPQNVEANLGRICELVPDLADELMSSVDVPLKVLQDGTGKSFLGCDYNRDGDSFRSPWDNEYYPALAAGTEDEATKPSAKLRKLEVRMNQGFDIYRELYYEGGTSSVYLWDLDDSWAGVVLLKKGAFVCSAGCTRAEERLKCSTTARTRLHGIPVRAVAHRHLDQD